jgi:hypothetical protein
MKKTLVASLTVLVATTAFAYEIHHPNLRDAYKGTEIALQHIGEAQANNRSVEFGGHLEKAIALIRQAQQELSAGDQYNDSHQRH